MRVVVLAAIVFASALNGRAHAQAEDCAEASMHPLTLGVPRTGNFTDSFNDGPSGCGSTGNRTQWFTFTPVTSGRYMFSTCGSAQLDTHLGVSLSNQPCEGVATYVACNDDSCGAGAQVVLNMLGGSEYRIRVGAFGAPTNGGGYEIVVLQESSVPPSNDDCPDAAPASIGVTSGTTLGASGSLNLNTCGGSADSNDVYFFFTAGDTRRHRVSVCSSEFDAVVSVHSACPAGSFDTFQIGSGCATSVNPPVFGCTNRGALTNVGLNGGQTVFVRVAGAADQTGTGSPFVGFGEFDLRIEQVAFDRPANDECTQFHDLNAESLPFVHDVEGRGAFNDVDPGSCNSSAANEGYFGVWYRYVAPASGILVVSEQSAADVTIGIWAGDDCNDLGSSIRCSDTETVVESVTAGQVYRIMISSFDPAGPTSAYSTRFNFLPAPPNDLCVNALDISGESFPLAFEVNARNATNDIPDPTCNSGTSANASVYWRFTAPLSGGRLTLRETATDNQVAWAVYTGSCATPTQIACFAADSSDLNFVDTTPGETYLIQLSRRPTTPAVGRYVGTIDFEAPPQNDECIDAVTVTGDFEFRNSLASETVVPGMAVCSGQPAGFAKDTWYRFTAPDDGQLSVLPLSTQVVRMALYRSSTCVNIDAGFVGCSEGPNFQNVANLALGESVYIRIGGVAPGQVFNGLAIVTFVPARGRCCVGTTDCVMATASECATLSGTYGGNGTFCVVPDATAPETFVGGQSGTIPDLDLQGMAFELEVPGTAGDLVGDVYLNINVQHTYVGDLVMSLEKDGRSVVVTNRTRRGVNSSAFGSSADLSGVYSIRDDAGSSWWPVATGLAVPAGLYQASHNGDLRTSLRETFNGIPRAGTWTLRIADETGSDTGTLLGWGLTILPPDGDSLCGGVVPSCVGDFNGSGFVDLNDLLDYVSVWVMESGQSGPGLPTDHNQDGTVNLNDLLDFVSDWTVNAGSTCP